MTSADDLRRGGTPLDRLDALARRARDLPAAEPKAGALAAFVERMEDNLDTPAACVQLFGLVTEVNRMIDTGDVQGAAPLAAAWAEILGALGLVVHDEVGQVPEAILELARRRDSARASKDFSTAPPLRDEIVAAGYVAEDSADGTVVRPA